MSIRFFKAMDMEGYNNRAFKTEDDQGKVRYEIRNAAVDARTVSTEEFEGATFEVTTGDYSGLLALVNTHLELARVSETMGESNAVLTAL